MNNNTIFVKRDLQEFHELDFLVKYLLGHNGFIAGGCFKNIFTNTKVKDIDMFFRNETDYTNAKILFDADNDYEFYYENKKVYAVKNKETGIVVELIRWKFGEPEDIINDFDFTITKFCLYSKPKEDDDGFENMIIHHNKFFEHLFMKRTVIDNKCLFPASTFERVIKYTKYGYMPCRETKEKLIEAIRSIPDIDNISNSLYDGID